MLVRCVIKCCVSVSVRYESIFAGVVALFHADAAAAAAP